MTGAVTGSPVDPVTAMGRALGLGESAETVRSEEQLRLSAERVAVERVRVTRRVVTETRMVPVTVRREILDVQRTPIDGAQPTADVPAGSVDAQRSLTIVLREEVPTVTVTVRPAERVRIAVRGITAATTVRTEVLSERVDVQTTPPPTRQR